MREDLSELHLQFTFFLFPVRAKLDPSKPVTKLTIQPRRRKFITYKNINIYWLDIDLLSASQPTRCMFSNHFPKLTTFHQVLLLFAVIGLSHMQEIKTKALEIWTDHNFCALSAAVRNFYTPGPRSKQLFWE